MSSPNDKLVAKCYASASKCDSKKSNDPKALKSRIEELEKQLNVSYSSPISESMLLENTKQVLLLRTENKKLKEIVQKAASCKKPDKPPKYDESKRIKKLAQILAFFPEMRRKMLLEKTVTISEDVLCVYKQRIDELQNIVNQLTTDNNTLQNKTKELLRLNSALKHKEPIKITKPELQNEELVKINKALLEKNNYLLEMLRNKDAESEKLRDSLQKLTSECYSKLSEASNQVQAVIETFKRRNEDNNLRMQQLENQIKQFTKDITSFRERLSEIQTRFPIALKAKMAELKNALTEMDKLPATNTAAKSLAIFKQLNDGLFNNIIEHRYLVIEYQYKDMLNVHKQNEASLHLIAQLLYNSLKVFVYD